VDGFADSQQLPQRLSGPGRRLTIARAPVSRRLPACILHLSKGFLARMDLCQPGQEENMVFLVASGWVRVYLGYEEKEFNPGILSE